MSWHNIIGQARAKKYLQRAVTEQRIAHAYLLWGPRGIGKDALAIEFARTVLCQTQKAESCGVCPECKKVNTLQHPNLKIIFALPPSEKDSSSGEEKMKTDIQSEVREQMERKASDNYFHFSIPRASVINTGSVREIRRESSMTAFDAGKKIFIISDAELMNEASQNALLKVLEEPPADTIFLLTTSRKELLRPTILSRCQSIRCDALLEDEIETALKEREHVEPKQARLVAQLANGDYSRAVDLLGEDLIHLRESAVNFLRAVAVGKPVQIFEEMDFFLDSDRKVSEQFLQIMLLWLRDAMLMQEGKERVINVDQSESLSKFVERYKKAELSATIAVVERALDLLRKNVYLQLIFVSLAIQLQRILLHEKNP
jgi:DNA polymerase-3 subunit delta'